VLIPVRFTDCICTLSITNQRAADVKGNLPETPLANIYSLSEIFLQIIPVLGSYLIGLKNKIKRKNYRRWLALTKTTVE
jgi:hypothetical protein